MKGKIISILNHGSIIQIMIKTRKGDMPVNFDQRMFWGMVESLGTTKLIGESVEYKAGSVYFPSLED